MSGPDTMFRIDVLASGYCDRVLSAGEAAELEGLIAGDPRLRRRFVRHLILHARLARDAGIHSSDAASARAASAGAAPAVRAGGSARLRFPGRFGLAGGLLAAAATAAMVVWAVRQVPPEVPGPPASPLKTLRVSARVVLATAGVEVLGSDGGPPQAGTELHEGQTLRTAPGECYAVLAYPDGTRLELGPDSIVRLAAYGSGGSGPAGKRVLLSQGVLRADVAPQPAERPLTVATPTAEVRVVGTRLQVSSASPETTRVDVEQGRVEVVRQSDGRTVEVVGGGFAVAGAGLEPLRVGRLPRLVVEPLCELGFAEARAIAWSPDGRTLLAGSSRKLVRWTGAGDERVANLRGRRHDGVTAEFSADGNTLAVHHGLDDERFVRLWDLPGHRPRLDLPVEVRSHGGLAMPPDASWIATVDRSPSHTCQVWDGRTGELLSSIGIKIRMQSVAASPDGRLLALGLNDLGVREKNKILLCDPRTGNIRATLATRLKDLNSTAFSPDGRLLAAGFRGQLQLWDVETGTLRRIITGHERQLWRLAFSPDGSLIAAGATDGFIWIWRVADGGEHLVINTGGRTAKGLAFSPDGRTLASLFSGTPVRLWAVPPFDDGAP